MENEKVKRKQYIVATKFQIKYVAYMLFVLYVGAAIAGYTVYYTTWITLGEKLANVYPRGRLIYIFHASNLTLLLRILLITPIFVIIGTFLSHRIVGPISRIGQYIDSLIQGDYSKGLILRKKDEFKILGEDLTLLRDKMREGREKRKKASMEIIKTLEHANLNSSALQTVKTKLEEIEE